MGQKKVIIVNDGTFKSRDPKYYQSFIEILRRNLDKVKLRDDHGEEINGPAAAIQVVESSAEAWGLVGASKVDIVIFISVGMYNAACELLSKFPDLTVLVLTGVPVRDQPYLIPKLMFNHDIVKYLMMI